MKRVLVLLIMLVSGPLFSAVSVSPFKNPLVFETYYSPISMGRGMTGMTAVNSIVDAIQNPASFKQSKYLNISYVAQRNLDNLPVNDNDHGFKYKRHHYNFFAGIGIKPHKYIDVGFAYLVPNSGQQVLEDYPVFGDDFSFEVVDYRASERLEQIAVPIKMNLNEFFSVGLTLSYFKYTQKRSYDERTQVSYHSQFWHPTFGFVWDISPRVLIGGRYKPRIKSRVTSSYTGEDVEDLAMPEERALGIQYVVNPVNRFYLEGALTRYGHLDSAKFKSVTNYHLGYEFSPAQFFTLRLGGFTRRDILKDPSDGKTNYQRFLTAGLSLNLKDRLAFNFGYIDGDYLDASENRRAHVSAGIDIKI